MKEERKTAIEIWIRALLVIAVLIFLGHVVGCSQTIVTVKSELIEIIDPNSLILYSSFTESAHYGNTNFIVKTSKELVEGKVMDMLEFKFAKSTVTPDPNTTEAMFKGVTKGVVGIGGP